jgi:uncharacterized protein YerC
MSERAPWQRPSLRDRDERNDKYQRLCHKRVGKMTTDELEELTRIKKLLVLQLLRDGATSEDIDKATGMGASNIRAMFPKVRKKS